jgi:hypothetical protein
LFHVAQQLSFVDRQHLLDGFQFEGQYPMEKQTSATLSIALLNMDDVKLALGIFPNPQKEIPASLIVS